MKHLLILISILLLSSPVIVDNHKGDVVSSKPYGLGILTYPWGTKYVGEWKEGRFWNGIGYDKNRKIKYKYVNGVKQ